ncbi:MAG TPA: DotI/IcmL/TraM family protein [Gammaproteobacteria bacterium]|nr:DotI/IcmL/TraM family protein [Gammaproteobacteria bacterium]
MTEEWQRLTLTDDFYRDGIRQVIFIVFGLLSVIVVLAGLSLFIFLDKPVPTTFSVQAEWRVQPPIPLDKPHLTKPDLLQWVASVISRVFIFDFVNYDSQLESYKQYFTEEGWKIFLDQLNIYANYNTVLAGRLFVSGEISSAPFIIKEGRLLGKASWWVQIPMQITYAGVSPLPDKSVTFQVLIERVPTLNNLSGVAIGNIILAPIE